MEPSVFDVLNVFCSRWFLNRDHLIANVLSAQDCSRWFLNRDHLIANVLSAQEAEDGRYTWVDFLPPFHTPGTVSSNTPTSPLPRG